MTTVNISALLTKTREEEDTTIGAKQAKSGVCSLAKSPFQSAAVMDQHYTFCPWISTIKMEHWILARNGHSSQDKLNKTESSANYKIFATAFSSGLQINI